MSISSNVAEFRTATEDATAKLRARLTAWHKISRDVFIRQNGWIGDGRGGWQWQVEVGFSVGDSAAMLSPRQARLLAKTLLRFAEECEHKTADEARHADH